MVNREILKLYKCTPEDWRKKLEYAPGPPGGTAGPGILEPPPSRPVEEAPPINSQEEKLNRLRRRIRSRVEAGRQYNLSNYAPYKALDAIWGSGFRQVSPTVLMDTIKKCENKPTEEIESTLKSLGLDMSGIFVDELDPKTGKSTKVLNAPVFLSVTIPLVAAYLMIRRA